MTVGLPIQMVGEDFSKNPGLSVQQLASFLRDIDYQPAWRVKADVDADYYDSNQYDAKTLQDMAERGIPAIVVNLIAPTINLILGMEAKTRVDWVVKADNDEDVDFARAMTKKLQEAERMSRADRGCSDAYSAEVKAGLGWVHTRRQRMNPWAYPYAVEYVHRGEIWWDWHDRDPMLRQARYLVRRKWYDTDVVLTMFPQNKAIIEQISSGWSIFENRAQLEVGHPLYQDWLQERDFYWHVDEWRNLDRRRVAVYEVWYRVWTRGMVMELPDGRVFEYNKQNGVHQAAVARGLAKLMDVPMPKMRLSYWVGPHRLVDIPSPCPHEDFPYVPFWGYREDRTGVPYGHIRAMRPLQDEVNARRARMLWQLSARRVIAFSDVIPDKRALEAEIARPDAMVYLKRKNFRRGIGDEFQVDDNLGLNAQQMEAYRDAADRLQDVANVYQEQLGKAGAADSGIAIAQLIEQGTTALAELNENYQFARQQVGEQLFSFVRQDMEGTQEEVTIDDGIGQTRTVKLNEEKLDPAMGRKYKNNDVALTRASVVLDNVPSSATFREKQFKDLTDLVKKLPAPELQAAMLDMVVMASDVPFKEEIAKRIRQQLGIVSSNVDAMSEEEKAQIEKQLEDQDRIKALEETVQELEAEAADLENRKTDAEIEKVEAETEKIRADTEKTEVETQQAESGDERIPGADPHRLPRSNLGEGAAA